MARSKLVNTVEDTTQAAARKASEAFLEAAERLAPLVDQAGDYLGPLTEEARRLSAELASDTYSRIKPVLRDAQIRGARLASDALGKVQPTIDGALDAVSPAVDATVQKVRPVVDDVLGGIPPLVDGARSKVQEDVLPKLATLLKDAASQPLAAEAAAQLALATAVVSSELRKNQKTKAKRGWGKIVGKVLLAGAVLAGVVIAVRKLITPPSDGWHAHSPADAYVADPVADEVDDLAEDVEDLVDDAGEAAEEVVETVTETVGDAAEAVAETAGDAAEAVAETAGDAAEAVEEAVDEVSQEAEAGGDDASPLADSPYGEGSYAGSEPPEGFVVKANSRTKRYRLPGTSAYDNANADVWFASPEAAEAAGFVKAQR